jgi:cell division protein FtsN
MNQGKTLRWILMGVIAILLAGSYGIGFYVGQESGYQKEKEKCDKEKKKLLKIIAELSPVSRPVVPRQTFQKQPEEKQEEKPEIQEPQKTEPEPQPEPQRPQPEEEVKQVKEEKVVEKKAEKRPEEFEKVKAGKYYIQVGVFRNKANALKLSAKLNQMGFNTKTVVVRGFVKVIVGDFDSLESAQEAKERIESIGNLQPIIRRVK